ncbi:MAG: MoaD/ThiS family protein [Bryobacteraceae bacterium]|nr:MoaD/ThiS family protein [Bryobacteraceae bacterium]MDW8377600.1 MoaD/ThiS family protein [Bryobacterales bacterium]
MARVFIPSLLRSFTGGSAEVEANGATVRELIEDLEARYPGIRQRLLEGSHLRPNISVAVDGEVSPLGLLETVSPTSEVHFLAAIKGGMAPSMGSLSPSSAP